MNDRQGINSRLILLVVAADVVQFVIMLSFKKVATALPQATALAFDPLVILSLAITVLQMPFFWLGIAGMLASFIIWPAVLTALDLSVAFPLGSMSFVLIPLLSTILLGEHISILRWIGVLVIASGVALLSVFEQQPRETQ